MAFCKVAFCGLLKMVYVQFIQCVHRIECLCLCGQSSLCVAVCGVCVYVVVVLFVVSWECVAVCAAMWASC